MELAFATATSSNNKIMFCIKPSSSDVSQVSTAATAPVDEEMKDEEGLQGSSNRHKKEKRDKVKAIPRKAIKNLINNELEKQS